MINVTNSVVEDNKADVNAGGFYIHRSKVEIADTAITRNKAIGGQVGGIFSIQSNVTLTSVEISGNLGGNTGGGMYVWAGRVVVDSSSINSNTATHGGGLYVKDFASTRLVNCTLWGNTAVHGSALYNELSTSSIISDTWTRIYDNSPPQACLTGQYMNRTDNGEEQCEWCEGKL